VAPKPVNVLISQSDALLTVAQLRRAGVARIGLGPALGSPRRGLHVPRIGELLAHAKN